uniref:Uncharacterized protein n=1 Tax=Arsenophonus endosymbiont of Trialeurodes vaporariorum TaxID=235567 RepID=A0A3B0M495_9GAMM
MTNTIQRNIVTTSLVPNIHRRQEADPELKRRFDRFLIADQYDNASSTSGWSSVLNTLAYSNSSATLNNVYLLRHGNSLTYRLLNGPMMMGMVIIAHWQKPETVHLQLKPANSIQHLTLTRVAKKLTTTLAKRGFLLSLEIENGVQ